MRSLSGLTTGSIMSNAMCDRIRRGFKSWSSISTLATIIIIRWCGHDNITLKLHHLIFLVDLEHFFRQSEAWKIQRILSFYRCFGRRGTWRTSIFVASSQRSFDSSTARGSSWSRFTKFDFDGLEVDWEDMFSFVCCLLFVCCFGMLKVFSWCEVGVMRGMFSWIKLWFWLFVGFVEYRLSWKFQWRD